MPANPTAAAAHIASWLIESALGSTTGEEALDGLVLRLRAEGIAIDRGHLAYTTLHPLLEGHGVTWKPATGAVSEGYGHGGSEDAVDWNESPIRHVIANHLGRMRRRLTGPSALIDFPVLRTLADEGLTDYTLFTCGFDSFFRPFTDDADPTKAVAGMVCSFATAREGGFTEEEVETLHSLLKPLAVVVKMADQRQVARNLASCYIGRDAGPLVLGGAIRRGDGQSTPAVVWMSDLRASTEMSMTLPRDEFLATLNAFFDCTAGAVEEEGGETLTFIGDSALAIFPIDQFGEVGARKAALRAAARAEAALTALNARRAEDGRRGLEWGLALHAGVIEYGNIGSLGRHCWTVIGPVVNETARLETTTKTTGEPVVASRAFVDQLPEPWRLLGAFDLAGVPGAFEVFGPPKMDRPLSRPPASEEMTA